MRRRNAAARRRRPTETAAFRHGYGRGDTGRSRKCRFLPVFAVKKSERGEGGRSEETNGKGTGRQGGKNGEVERRRGGTAGIKQRGQNSGGRMTEGGRRQGDRGGGTHPKARVRCCRAGVAAEKRDGHRRGQEQAAAGGRGARADGVRECVRGRQAGVHRILRPPWPGRRSAAGTERTVSGTVARLAFSGILCYTVGDGLIAGGTA